MKDHLMEIFTISMENDFIFSYKTDGEVNSIVIETTPIKKINININDDSDKNLNNLLKSKLQELKNLIQ